MKEERVGKEWNMWRNKDDEGLERNEFDVAFEVNTLALDWENQYILVFFYSLKTTEVW